MVNRHPGRVVSVGGGKGGVGKSVVAANLAVAMAQAGARVVVVDADLGAANLHTLFGVARPGPGVEAFLAGAVESLDDALVDAGVPGLLLVPGTGGTVGAANLGAARKQKLIRHVRALDADVVVVDVGAGVGFNVLDLWDAADLRLVVMSPQLTSAQNAYGFLKGAVFRELRRIAARTGQQALVDGAEEAAAPTAGVLQLLARIGEAHPELARALQGGLAGFGACLLGNQLFEPAEANVVYALSRMAQDFLGLQVPVLGALRASRRVHDSVSDGRPYLLHAGVEGDEVAATLRTVARTLLKAPLPRQVPLEELAGGAPAPPLPEVPALPVAFNAYERAHQRAAVDLPARLVFSGGLRAVRVVDVSDGGALLELDQPPPVGTRATLLFSSLGHLPNVVCVVRHLEPSRRRAGVRFLCEPEVAQVVAEAVRRAGTPDG